MTMRLHDIPTTNGSYLERFSLGANPRRLEFLLTISLVMSWIVESAASVTKHRTTKIAMRIADSTIILVYLDRVEGIEA